MWNHAPQMLEAMHQADISPPHFEGEEMEHLVAFLYSLRYFEPAGSSYVGESVFAWRGCNRCHGDHAEGSTKAPALRGRGRNYNVISLGSALWRHGYEMYLESQQAKIGWPTLVESDIGDLLSFLNSPANESK